MATALKADLRPCSVCDGCDGGFVLGEERSSFAVFFRHVAASGKDRANKAAKTG
jgi:hypothetical protein